MPRRPQICIHGENDRTFVFALRMVCPLGCAMYSEKLKRHEHQGRTHSFETVSERPD